MFSVGAVCKTLNDRAKYVWRTSIFYPSSIFRPKSDDATWKLLRRLQRFLDESFATHFSTSQPGRVMSASFFQKPIGIATLVGGALFGPYAYFGENSERNSPSTSQLAQYDPIPGHFANYTNTQPLEQPALGGFQPMQPTSVVPLVGRPNVVDLREVLRFDVNPAWVMQNFPRVTTVLAETRLDGLRVPFVSGTQATDIAGALTYYFDATQSVKRIQFHGKSGDPTMLSGLMVQFYRLEPEASLGGHLYTTRWNNRITSVLQLTPAPVIYAHDQNARFQVFLEINQPSTEYGLTREAEQVLQAARVNGSW
jgi:hypothetical protein